MKVSQKEREQRNSNFEPWPQASKFNLWRVSFRREVLSGATHPRLSSDWLPEIDIAANLEDSRNDMV